MATTPGGHNEPAADDTGDDVMVIELTPEEAWARFDADVRQRLGISAAEFARRYDAGVYDDPNDDSDTRWLGFGYEGLKRNGFPQ